LRDVLAGSKNKVNSLDRELMDMVKEIQFSESKVKEKEKLVKKAKRVTERLTKKIVQFGGESML
jgi:wobble nucleotide-excising tRNase